MMHILQKDLLTKSITNTVTKSQMSFILLLSRISFCWHFLRVAALSSKYCASGCIAPSLYAINTWTSSSPYVPTV